MTYAPFIAALALKLGYERDICPLFRETDVSSMSKAFDLASYNDVRANADEILVRVANGSMP
jgi:hypothetical protein